MEQQVRKMFQCRDTEDFTTAVEEEDTTELEEWFGCISEHRKPDILATRPCRVSELELKNIFSHIQARTATGLDDFPARLLKKLGPQQCLALQEMLSDMLRTGTVTKEWAQGRKEFLYKGARQRYFAGGYRPGEKEETSWDNCRTVSMGDGTRRIASFVITECGDDELLLTAGSQSELHRPLNICIRQCLFVIMDLKEQLRHTVAQTKDALYSNLCKLKDRWTQEPLPLVASQMVLHAKHFGKMVKSGGVT
ncbi:hypothetical protein HPB48_026888 [Haemaphysalis longicornis]|uniref:Uncharacterized protein n=1 Tax=Haemaphysalis longicornis TaxID=44386 RepID=A0A9J6HAU6_HAELO|nr:hypothetical protein HPB48_026888 [Haemaphysalis longicornis]